MYPKMKCMKCGQAATHKFVTIDQGKVYDIYLCAEHASERSPYQKPKIPLSEILEGLLKQDLTLQQEETAPSPPDLRCRTCGLPFSAYKKSLLLGCSDCYQSFREYLLADLRKFHGASRHIGRQPGPTGSVPRLPTPKVESVIMESESAVSAPKTPPSPTKGGQVLIKDPDVAIEELMRTMKKAIADEDFAKAARCRDQIREIQESRKPTSSPEA